jgi:2-aminoadipate transaminase
MSLEKRHEVLKVADKFDSYIIEDNPYGELRFEGEHIKSIKELDDSGRVIYVGSFSKILSPGLRVGFVVAKPEIIDKMVVCKQAEDVHTCLLAQMIVSEFLKRYDIDALIEKERLVYKAKYGVMRDAIKRFFPDSVRVTSPQGGIFLWCDGGRVDGCVDKGVVVVPGRALMANSEDVDAFRLNYSMASDEQIERGIGILGGILK